MLAEWTSETHTLSLSLSLPQESANDGVLLYTLVHHMCSISMTPGHRSTIHTRARNCPLIDCQQGLNLQLRSTTNACKDLANFVGLRKAEKYKLSDIREREGSLCPFSLAYEDRYLFMFGPFAEWL